MVVGVAAGAAAVALALSGCSSSSTSSSSTTAPTGDLIIGGALALSGGFSTYDQEPLNALQLYVTDVNKKGGIGGRQVKIVTSDIASDPTKGPVAANAVIAQGAEIVLVSCDFDMGSPAAVTAIAAGKVAISVCAGSPNFGPAGLGKLAFTVGTPVQSESSGVAQFTYDQGYKNVFLLTDSATQYNVSFGTMFQDVYKQLGGSIDGTADFKATDTTIATQLAQLKALPTQPDAIVIGTNLPGGASAVREIRSSGITIPIVSTSGLDGTSWLPQVPGLTDFYADNYASTNGDDSNALTNQVTTEYTAAYGAPPTTSFAYMGWALGQVIQAGVEKAGTTDGDALASAMETITNLDTPVGPTSYSTESHAPTNRTVNFNEVTDGTSKFLKKVTPTITLPVQ